MVLIVVEGVAEINDLVLILTNIDDRCRRHCSFSSGGLDRLRWQPLLRSQLRWLLLYLWLLILPTSLLGRVLLRSPLVLEVAATL